MTPKSKKRTYGKQGWPNAATNKQVGLRLRFRAKAEADLIRRAVRSLHPSPSVNCYILEAALTRARIDLGLESQDNENENISPPRPKLVSPAV